MKKLIALLTALTIMICMGAGACLAYADTFVPSISSKGAPDVVEATDKNGKDVTDKLIITPYSQREELSNNKKELFEKGFENVDIKDLASKIDKKVDPEKLAVTDVFYVHEKNDSGSIELGTKVTITYNVSPNRFVQIFYFDGKKWVPVETTVNGDGTITFQVDAFGPYLILTNTVNEVGPGGYAPASPQTGYDETSIWDVIKGILGIK